MGIAIGIIVAIIVIWAIGNGTAKTTAQVITFSKKTRQQAPVVAGKTLKTTHKAVSTGTKATAKVASSSAKSIKTQINHAKNNSQSGWQKFKAEVKDELAQEENAEMRALRVAESKVS